MYQSLTVKTGISLSAEQKEIWFYDPENDCSD